MHCDGHGPSQFLIRTFKGMLGDTKKETAWILNNERPMQRRAKGDGVGGASFRDCRCQDSFHLSIRVFFSHMTQKRFSF